MKQQLEKSLYGSRPIGKETKIYTIVDLESLSATALYTDHLPKMGMGGFKLPKIKQSFGQNVIPLGDLDMPGLKDIHETFKIDRYENLYGGHITFVPLKGIKKRFEY